MRRTIIGLGYLVCGGVIAALLIICYALDRPVGFALEQALNYHYRQGSGASQKIAGWLIENGVSRDWSATATGIADKIPYPVLISAASELHSYPYQTYLKNGRPQGQPPGPFLAPVNSRPVDVASMKEIIHAIGNAQPGDIITIQPGSYNFERPYLPVQVAGTPSQPIYLRAQRFGSVELNFDSLEGFLVMAPYWVFENLRIRGSCLQHSDCEHAFHVVGNARAFTLRNSELVNFNAAIKVNLQHALDEYHYPDNGLIEYNSFFNETPRKTGNPVTLINIDAADHWVVRGNFIADFAKAGADRISYAGFMKGNGRGGIFERNLVICEGQLPADEGIRVGLSFGGGGTAAKFCKEHNCEREFTSGIMRNNIIINCSRDVGIYLNRAANSEIYHNLLYNNLGVDVRFDTSTANLTNNIISGRIRDRDNGRSTTAGNYIFKNCLGESRQGCELSRAYHNPDRADFRLKNLDNSLWQEASEAPLIEEDFCGQPLPQVINAGPIQHLNTLDCIAIPSGQNSH